MNQGQKDDIFNLILKNKFAIFNRKNKEETFKKFLNDNNINTNLDIKHMISFLKNIDIKCKIENCNNERIFKGLRTSSRYEFGFLKYCSPKCENKSHSNRQLGENNSFHKISKESLNSMKLRLSSIMKDKISKGEFVPPITNSWAGSKIKVLIRGEVRYYRSSWEAFFHLCNDHLLYEKISIKYEYKGDVRNYITDFVDPNVNIIYEIKPDRTKGADRNKAKQFFAKKWCLENNYRYMIISDDWFRLNYNINIDKLVGQPDEEKIKKRLKQFYEN
jgi:hypothetical protein